MITDDFAPLLLRTFADPAEHGVHLLFNEWWQHAPDDVKDAYVTHLTGDPRYEEFLADQHYAEPLVLADLGDMGPGTLGRTYHDWIVDNRLAAAIATDYRRFHDALETAGMLDGMPEPMKYAVLRGFQTHDFQHIVTGYDSSGRGEIALQAFCLAQLQFPYFAMWMSVVTTRMTFIDPRMITPMMDAITDGWQLGRTSQNIQCCRWETMLADDLDEVRSRVGVSPHQVIRRSATTSPST